MILIVAGSRSFALEEARVLKEISAAIKEYDLKPTLILSGHATGVDIAGEKWAVEHFIPLRLFRPDWRYGKIGGPARNEAMCKVAHAALVVWDGISPGSADLIARASKHKLKTIVRLLDKIPKTFA